MPAVSPSPSAPEPTPRIHRISSAIRLAAALLRHRLFRPSGPVLPHRFRDRGMSTAEYAIGTVSAVAFAAVLYAILTSGEVREVLTGIVVSALQSTG
ncbi:DUF4244 domain-containing protein [Nocardiopsis coralliicola]